MKEPVHVIMVSSIRPAPTSAASMTMHRHLVNRAGISMTVLPAEISEILPGHRLAKMIGRLKRTRFARFAADLSFRLHNTKPLEKHLPAPDRNHRRSLVFTLATLDGCWVAQRYAALHGLPLLAKFDDWWPDISRVHGLMRGALEQRYRQLHRASKVSLAIADGMKAELGPHPNSHVVLPMPDATTTPVAPFVPGGNPLRAVYLGNMFDYGPMLARLAEVVLGQEEIRMEFRGAEPQLPEPLKAAMRARGLLYGFLDGAEFERWFQSFDVYLVAMFFEPEQNRRVRTCFATKLVDYCRLGRPVVIWAPEQASVVQWARKHDAALCVCDPKPRKLLAELKRLADDPERQKQLAAAARRAYDTDFNPAKLQADFETALESAFPG